MNTKYNFKSLKGVTCNNKNFSSILCVFPKEGRKTLFRKQLKKWEVKLNMVSNLWMIF
jgi:hypothetical protein